ncbi:tetratricopeptide (TPR) repeat protein [Povalibacter uvarum]|uniref:Tetratricopeptide (TPR) repeat protein n=1 Tax=Povalibacter uvarum TaxID=732238 RepID=A0A841HRS9_9GAMM|nr:tetratricopeptide repeat protein [Povalibacter uvarum]MBB6096061.1 tetratricopeptide (TPR) repeat protein [Povalibacter uvarum]
MQTYSAADIERILRLSRSTLRGLIKSGFVKPERGPRRELRFSFQDLIVLRAARTLLEAKVPARRINRSLQDLRRHLPEEAPLSGLSIGAVGDQVVVRDGKNHFHADSGQYVLGFDVSVENGVLRVVERKEETAKRAEPEPADMEEWFNRALELEETNPGEARAAYQRVVDADPENCAAWTNLGRLLHEEGETRDAEHIYRRAVEQCGPDPVLMFNLGVLMEDLGRPQAALEAYQSAITEDPSLADGHFNLARLYEAIGQQQHAIRHLGQYRRLVKNADVFSDA